MIEASIHFPAGFLWGTATSAHQVEGANRANDWSQWEQESGRILEGHQAGAACDWWGGRWREDFDRAAADGHNAHRLSIEWSRVEPSPGVWDQTALDQYREMLTGALARGLTPMVTLHHFTNPIWVMDAGGWRNPRIVEWFERYVLRVVEFLGDLVSLWVTINEPNFYLFAGYVDGSFPPGEKSLRATHYVAAHLLRAHAAAYHVIHSAAPDARVGMAHHYRSFKPARQGSFLDARAAKLRSRLFNGVFPKALCSGNLSILTRQSIPEAAGTQDFFGLNYYTRELSRWDLLHPSSLLRQGEFEEGAEVSPTGFIANQPKGFWEALVWAHSYRLPIYITENGLEDEDDILRPTYLAEHVHQAWRAANMCWKVRGYFHWSLVDNFEWERGWTQRFGLYALDRETQMRKARSSARFYAEICQANGLSTDMIARYAPKAIARVFPPREADDLKA